MAWLGNLELSACIYGCAGVVRSLEVRDGRPALCVARPDWPAAPADRGFGPLPALHVGAVGFALFIG